MRFLPKGSLTYVTPVHVVVHNYWLGLFTFWLKVGLFLFAILYEATYRHQVLEFHEVEGVVALNLMNSDQQLVDCRNFDGEKELCSNAGPELDTSSNSLLVPTYSQLESEYERVCKHEGSQPWMSCDLVQVTPPVGKTLPTYFPNAETKSVKLEHAIKSLNGTLVPSSKLEGYLVIKGNKPFCQKVSDRGDRIVRNGPSSWFFQLLFGVYDCKIATRGKDEAHDNFLIGDLLEASNIKLPQPNSTKKQEFLENGAEILLTTRYTNVIPYWIGVTDITYSIHVTVDTSVPFVKSYSNTKYKMVGSELENSGRETYKMSGVHIVMLLDGALGQVDIYNIILLWLAFMGLLDAGRMFVEWVFRSLPTWREYEAAIYRYDVDVGFQPKATRRNIIWEPQQSEKTNNSMKDRLLDDNSKNQSKVPFSSFV